MASNDDLVADLFAEFAKLRKTLSTRQDGHERALVELSEEVARIIELLGQKDPAFILSPWWWPSMTKEEAGAAWKLLTAWVDDVLIKRYDVDPEESLHEWQPGELPHGLNVLRCWFAHPGVVDKLSALYWAQRVDYRRNAPAHGALEWQHSWLPKTLSALSNEFSANNCYGQCPYLKDDTEVVSHEQLGLRERMRWIKVDIAARPK